MGFAGQFGGGMLFGETLNTPLLKASLSHVLARMPVFSGRLVFGRDGRLDVWCNDAGARFVAASTSATLADVTAALRAQPYVRVLSNPWMPYWPPHDVDLLVRQQWPLAAGFVLHLSGGGSALWVAAHHCCADFESLQTLAAHWAAAYNEALRTAAAAPRRPLVAPPVPSAGAPPAAPAATPPAQLSPAAAASPGPASHAILSVASCSLDAADGAAQEPPEAAAPGYEASLPEDLRGPVLSVRRREALTEPGGPLAAAAAAAAAEAEAVPPRRELAEATAWSGLAVAAYALYHMVWRGGGTEVRCCRISAQRLAQLKAQANAELQEERGRTSREREREQEPGQEREGGSSGPIESGAGTKLLQLGPGRLGASAGVSGGVGEAGGAGASAGGGGAWGLEGVRWVSTNDALIGRLLQVLHALPLRRASRLGCFVAADMRRRLAPPLPPAVLGNLLYNAHLAEVAPSDMGLGRLAASLRYALTHQLVPQFRGCLRRTAAALARVGPRRLVFAFCLEREARHNIFAPEGPVNLTNWDVRFPLWQFGPSPPLAFLPLAEIGPCVLLLHPAGPAREDGTCLLASMHRAAWRQLDAAGRDLGSML